MAAPITFLKSLQETLHAVFDRDESVFLIGEDILDPYGGAFKVSSGLSSKYPDRVITSPISEASIVGVGVGLALRGNRPIVEIMFGDFLTLCADQIVNNAAKYELMFAGQVKVPLVIRTAVGAGRGYGPTHSQSLEKMFLGVPNLRIVAPSHFHDPGKELFNAIYDSKPVLFLENKLLYPRKIFKSSENLQTEIVEEDNYHTVIIRNHAENIDPDVVLVTYGGVSRLVENILEGMAREEILATAILPACVSEPPIGLITAEIAKSGRAVIIEEAPVGFGWSSEVAQQIYRSLFKQLDAPIICVGNEPTVLPANYALEQQVIVNEDKIETAIMEVLSW
jgi:pyruvate/2-oxoglutarate/acetoin dehydrogenase E1 component